MGCSGSKEEEAPPAPRPKEMVPERAPSKAGSKQAGSKKGAPKATESSEKGGAKPHASTTDPARKSDSKAGRPPAQQSQEGPREEVAQQNHESRAPNSSVKEDCPDTAPSRPPCVQGQRAVGAGRGSRRQWVQVARRHGSRRSNRGRTTRWKPGASRTRRS